MRVGDSYSTLLNCISHNDKTTVDRHSKAFVLSDMDDST